MAGLAREVADFVADPRRCGTVIGTLAEELPVQEAVELIDMLRSRLDRTPEAVIVNAVYPAPPRQGTKAPPGTAAARAARRRVDLPLTVPPTTNLEAARRTVLNAIQQTSGVVSDPAPTVLVQQVKGDTVNLAGSFWVDVSKTNPDTARDAALTRIRDGLGQKTLPVTGAEGQARAENCSPIRRCARHLRRLSIVRRGSRTS